jgi:hypothetical protein
MAPGQFTDPPERFCDSLDRNHQHGPTLGGSVLAHEPEGTLLVGWK